MTMKQTLSEFMGCEDWEKAELCAFIDKQHEELKAKDELIMDMLADKVERYTCLNLETGERFMFERDAEEIDGWKERMRALGIEVNDD